MSFFKTEECKVCAAHLERIADLKDTIKRLEMEREAERAEYKRAIDVILVKQNLPAVGQGASQAPGVMDPGKYFAFLDEEVRDKKD